MAIERTGTAQTKRCDLVCFVNGIPFVVIENKRPTESLKKAGSQLIGYQNEDNLPHLFHFAQLLITMNRAEARYATVGTPQKFWQTWRDEEDRDEDIAPLANRKPTDPEKKAIFSGDFAPARAFFDALAAEGDRAITAQDRLIYALCRPERLLDLIRRFTVFEGGTRKIARHQQFFGIKAAMARLKQRDLGDVRKGGVIWHTQGSGKSLTMVMLGRCLALDRDIASPRIIIVTDRDDLDKQIKGTFKSCELEPVRARSGAHLAELIEARAPLVTTIINKFSTALAGSSLRDESADIFVLVDESHRTQTGRYGKRPKTLISQLEEVGVKASDIKLLAISHSHPDHIGNVSLFPQAILLVQAAEYDWVGPLGPSFKPEHPVKKLSGDHDVFGDDTVKIISTPGHTPGHQSLLVRLKKTGAVLLTGDAVHFKDNWDNRRVPAINFNKEQSVASLQRLADILVKEKAQLWINHDKMQRDILKMAPEYFD
jgi:glyoxylase-like metal-dependent hydrolase (beta-lactamase superfamily II)